MKKEIKIITNAYLASLSHAVGTTAADYLKSKIEKLEAAGFTVIHAVSRRNAVPNSYRWPTNMKAPHYAWDAEARTLELVPGQLEPRPKGHSIPANFTIAGQTVPPGFRCFKKNAEENSILVRPE